MVYITVGVQDFSLFFLPFLLLLCPLLLLFLLSLGVHVLTPGGPEWPLLWVLTALSRASQLASDGLGSASFMGEQHPEFSVVGLRKELRMLVGTGI